jgi:hypothetical protein
MNTGSADHHGAAIICENCEDRQAVEVGASPKQLEKARELGIAGGAGRTGTARVWVSGVGYGLLAVRHWCDAESRYQTSLLNDDGEIVHDDKPYGKDQHQ